MIEDMIEDMIDWGEITDVNIEKGHVRVVRDGEVVLPKSVVYEALDPETFKVVFIRDRVPIQQSVFVREGHPFTLSPLVVDFFKLRSGNYFWKSAALEDIKEGS
jgi:hypothetical protein